MHEAGTAVEKESLFGKARGLLEKATENRILATSIFQRLDGSRESSAVDPPPEPKSTETSIEALLGNIGRRLQETQADLNHIDRALGK